MAVDVIAVNMDTMLTRLIAVDKSEKNAEAIVSMAVMRRGVDVEFFTTVPHGAYSDGMTYEN